MARRDPERIRADIEALTEFERDYREYVHALEDEQRTGVPYWHPRAQAEKRANLLKKAPRAGRAREASGHDLTLDPPPFADGPPLTDFVSQVFAFEKPPWSLAANPLDAPRLVLDSIDTALGALQMELEAAEGPGTSASIPSQDQELRSRHWPTLVGRIRHVPLVLGIVADIGGAVVVVVAVGRFLGFW